MKPRQDSVICVRNKDKIREECFNPLLFPVHNKKFHSKTSNKANKMLECMYTYLMTFLETSSIHGLKYLIPKNRANYER